ncbi:MAG: DUF4291 domain-containing protein [Saprospiraceae bacterium]
MKVEKYNYQQTQLPNEGKHIIAQSDDDTITVYQAYNNAIANYAIANQKFGGSSYSFSRMTWVKPNFMWMMYRAGWATKENQERILAIKIKHEGFNKILREAVYSSFQEQIYKTHEAWKTKLAASKVRLQWDPDHDPQGAKLERKAIQLGIRGEMLQELNQAWITEISDVTDFVKEQHRFAKGDFSSLNVPFERVQIYEDQAIIDNLGLTMEK